MGVSQVSAFLQKELVICRIICYNRVKEWDAIFQKTKWGSNLFVRDTAQNMNRLRRLMILFRSCDFRYYC